MCVLLFKKCMLLNHWCEFWHLYGFCLLLGDGGNDVSMIQEADCGVGVEGKVRPSPSHRLMLTWHTNRFCALYFLLRYLSHSELQQNTGTRFYEDLLSEWRKLGWQEAFCWSKIKSHINFSFLVTLSVRKTSVLMFPRFSGYLIKH